ncbi:MAG TPA: TlyA family RNA methyltransferase [bacterium]|jgi:23S rRNA (cytidine1920-2'-O)/16S rRNA (cytidine1409-2'-O)-methyltransferase
MTQHASGTRRLDQLLVERGLAPTPARAQGMILAGEVSVDGTAVTKAGTPVRPAAAIVIHPHGEPFVSRGGLKLEHALDAFHLDVRGLVALDVGASTGGFTDCLLRRGVRRVYAVDVGTGQLAWSLRTDPRVVSLERQDIRGLRPAQLGAGVDLATVDVAFVSLFRVLPAMAPLVRSGGPIVALLKPQFEVGPKVAKGGVVRDPAAHTAVLREAADHAGRLAWTVRGVVASPIAGPEGNLEFFLLLDRDPVPGPPIDVDAIVVDAHERIRVRPTAPADAGPEPTRLRHAAGSDGKLSRWFGTGGP